MPGEGRSDVDQDPDEDETADEVPVASGTVKPERGSPWSKTFDDLG